MINRIPVVALEINGSSLLSVVNNFPNSEVEHMDDSDVQISGNVTLFDVRQIQCSKNQFLALGQLHAIPDVIAKNCGVEKCTLEPYQLLSNIKIDATSGPVWNRYHTIFESPIVEKALNTDQISHSLLSENYKL